MCWSSEGDALCAGSLEGDALCAGGLEGDALCVLEVKPSFSSPEKAKPGWAGGTQPSPESSTEQQNSAPALPGRTPSEHMAARTLEIFLFELLRLLIHSTGNLCLSFVSK